MTIRKIDIEDADDPRIEDYRHIRERDLVGRRGMFVAEGKVVLRVLFSAGRFEPVSALILDRRLEGMHDVLASATSDLPVYVASRAVLNAVTGFDMHRGILAMGRTRPGEDVEDVLRSVPQRATIVVLCGISNHDNMGAIFRNAAALGADALLIDRTSCDPLYRKAIRVSVGAALKVPYVRFGDIASIGSLLEEAGFAQFALSPAGKQDIADVEAPARVALYLGSEGEGLPHAVMERMTTMRIDQVPGFDSLNVAAASAIALHRLRNR